jgi:hypothetical protein
MRHAPHLLRPSWTTKHGRSGLARSSTALRARRLRVNPPPSILISRQLAESRGLHTKERIFPATKSALHIAEIATLRAEGWVDTPARLPPVPQPPTADLRAIIEPFMEHLQRSRREFDRVDPTGQLRMRYEVFRCDLELL